MNNCVHLQISTIKPTTKWLIKLGQAIKTIPANPNRRSPSTIIYNQLILLPGTNDFQYTFIIVLYHRSTHAKFI